MSKAKKDTTINLQLKAIELIKSQINIPQEPNYEIDRFRFDLKVEGQVDAEKKQIVVMPNINIINDQRSDVLGQIRLSCTFGIEPFENVLIVSNGITEASPEILGVLNSIAISTLRGVMFEHFRGTLLHNAILPIIDPKSFHYTLPMQEREERNNLAVMDGD